MSRLSALDSSFLRVETPTAHMHVGWCSRLELPAGAERLDTARLTATLAGRLHRTSRFRQRVVAPPLGLGEPLWADDPDFDLARHVEHGPDAPVDPTGLRALVDDFLSRPLPRDRPLWSLLVVERTEPGEAAVVGKIHHAMVDGIAAVELGMLLFDADPEAEPEAQRPWRAAATAGAARHALDLAAGQVRGAGRAIELIASPGSGVRVAGSALSLAGDMLRPAPASYLNGEISAARTLPSQRLEMADLDLVKRAAGTKLNDVLLAVVAGALRRLAVRRGEWPADLRVMVPVSTRADAGEGAGNRITFCFVTLPVGEGDARERLRRIRGETRALKASGRIAGSELLLRSLDPLPGPFKARVARLAAGPRMYNLTVSNVPGPPLTLYAAGARVASIFPVIPLSDGHALAVGALSYEGGMHIAAHADPVALPEARDLPALFIEALNELLGAYACDPSRELMAATAHPRGLRGRSLAGSRDDRRSAAGSSTHPT